MGCFCALVSPGNVVPYNKVAFGDGPAISYFWLFSPRRVDRWDGSGIKRNGQGFRFLSSRSLPRGGFTTRFRQISDKSYLSPQHFEIACRICEEAIPAVFLRDGPRHD